MTVSRFISYAAIATAAVLIVGAAWWLTAPTGDLRVEQTLVMVETEQPVTDAPLDDTSTSTAVTGAVMFVEQTVGGPLHRYQSLFGDSPSIRPADNLRDQPDTMPETDFDDANTTNTTTPHDTQLPPAQDVIVDNVLLPAIPLLTASSAIVGPPQYTEESARIVAVLPESTLAGEVSTGDVIAAVRIADGTGTVTTYPTPTAERLLDALSTFQPGSQILVVMGNGREIATTLSSAGALGLRLETYRVADRLPAPYIPPQVTSASGALATAIVIADELDPRDIIAGRTVVAMGYLNEEGAVSPVSDPEARISALPSDIDVIVVHNSQVKYFEKYAESVFGVDSLVDALAVLTQGSLPPTTPTEAP